MGSLKLLAPTCSRYNQLGQELLLMYQVQSDLAITDQTGELADKNNKTPPILARLHT